MPIDSNDISWKKSVVHDDSPANGGVMSSVVAPNNTKNTIWPDVPQSERTSGSVKYRKMHIHIADALDLTAKGVNVFVETATTASDAVVIFPGTHTDTQSTLTGSEQLYGGGQLDSNVEAGSSILTVLTEGASFDCLKDNMRIRISDQADVSATGNFEFHTIVGEPTYSGDVATVSIGTETLTNSYLAAVTRVSSVIEAGDVQSAYSGFLVSSSGTGAYDDTTYPVQTSSIGSIYQELTLSFTSDTDFDIIGDTLGVIGSGTISSDTSPINDISGAPYFTLYSLGFSGTYATGDSIVFTTSPSAVPVWYKRVVPAGAASLAGNKSIIGFFAESTD